MQRELLCSCNRSLQLCCVIPFGIGVKLQAELSYMTFEKYFGYVEKYTL
jgi:hypothetical protein